jgi:hypothetical protein
MSSAYHAAWEAASLGSCCPHLHQCLSAPTSPWASQVARRHHGVPQRDPTAAQAGSATHWPRGFYELLEPMSRANKARLGRGDREAHAQQTCPPQFVPLTAVLSGRGSQIRQCLEREGNGRFLALTLFRSHSLVCTGNQAEGATAHCGRSALSQQHPLPWRSGCHWLVHRYALLRLQRALSPLCHGPCPTGNPKVAPWSLLSPGFEVD